MPQRSSMASHRMCCRGRLRDLSSLGYREQNHSAYPASAWHTCQSLFSSQSFRADQRPPCVSASNAFISAISRTWEVTICSQSFLTRGSVSDDCLHIWIAAE